MSNTNVKSRWVDGNLEFYDVSDNRIFYIDGTNRKLIIDAAASIDHGTTSISGTEIGLLDTATPGSITASKVVSRDAGLRIPFATAVPAAAGSAAGDATAITADVNLVTAADGTKGVILPTGVAGMRIEVVNTVNSALLKVYPDTGGQINAGGANVAFSLAAQTAATFVCTAALTWYAEIGASGIINAQIAASAAIARSKLATDASQKYAVELRDLNGAALANAERAGSFNSAVVAGVPVIQGEITDNETEVSVGYAEWQVPPEAVAATDVTFRLPAALIKTAAAVNNGSTLDVEAFKKDGAGGVGSDICATAAVTFAADDTWYNKDFTITGASLSPGDVVLFKVTSSVVDSEAGGGTLRMTMERPMVLAGIKG